MEKVEVTYITFKWFGDQCSGINTVLEHMYDCTKAVLQDTFGANKFIITEVKTEMEESIL